MTPETTRHQTFRPGELPLVLLALLTAQPMNGYEVLGELGRLFGPDYKPSPGSVYPALQALLDETLIRSERGNKTYRVTTTGTDALERRAGALAAVEIRTGVRLRDAGDVRPVLERFVARVARVAGKVGVNDIEALLDAAAERIESLNGGTGHDDG